MGPYVGLTVRDDGEGIDEARMARIFEPSTFRVLLPATAAEPLARTVATAGELAALFLVF